MSGRKVWLPLARTDRPAPQLALPNASCVTPRSAWEADPEYLASNFGTTTSIRPADLTQAESCALGDLNTRDGICPRQDLPRPVNAFPLSGPPSVPGLFGMIGGVQEIAAGPLSPLDGACGFQGSVDPARCCNRRYPETDDHIPREGGSLRGTSWWLAEEEQRWMRHVSSRSRGSRTARPMTDGRRRRAAGHRPASPPAPAGRSAGRAA